MSLDGLVTERDIAALGIEAFRGVLNKFADLDLTMREHDPDAGIDARVKWPGSANHDVLFEGENVLQYKTGKVDKRVLKAEFHKPGVRDCLNKGGHYRLLVSQHCIPRKMDGLRKDLADLCKQGGFTETQCQILAASHVATWICKHPSIIVTRELDKGLPGRRNILNACWQIERGAGEHLSDVQKEELARLRKARNATLEGQSVSVNASPLRRLSICHAIRTLHTRRKGTPKRTPLHVHKFFKFFCVQSKVLIRPQPPIP